VRQAALTALWDAAGPRAREALDLALLDDDPQIRALAAALARPGGGSAGAEE
jgi:hypothetical protein